MMKECEIYISILIRKFSQQTICLLFIPEKKVMKEDCLDKLSGVDVELFIYLRTDMEINYYDILVLLWALIILSYVLMK